MVGGGKLRYKIERKKIRANEMLNYLQQKIDEQEMDKEIPNS